MITRAQAVSVINSGGSVILPGVNDGVPITRVADLPPESAFVETDRFLSETDLQTQISGVIDDATESGRVRMERVGGPWCVRPIQEGRYSVSAFGTASSNFVRENLQYNPAGTNSGLNLLVPHGGGNGADVRLSVYGTKAGLSLLRPTAVTTAGPFTVAVDGVTNDRSEVPNPYLVFQDTQSAVPNHFDEEVFLPLFSHLPEGYHEVQIRFPSDPTNDLSWFLYAVLTDGDAGYRPSVPCLMTDILNPVPFAAAGAMISQAWMKAFVWADYYNPTGGALTVTITHKTIVRRVLTVAAGGVAYWPETGPLPRGLAAARSGATILQHQASATGLLGEIFAEGY